MNPFYLLFPGASFLLLVSCLTLASVYTDIPWISACGWLGAVVLLGIWGVLERQLLAAIWRQRKTAFFMGQGGILLLLFLVLLGVVTLVSRPGIDRQFDLTGQNRHQLTPFSQKVVEQIKSRGLSLRLRAYFTDAGAEARFRSLIERYQALGLSLEVRTLDPQIHALEARADEITRDGSLVFETPGETPQRVTALAGTEDQVTTALSGLLRDGVKKIAFVTGHGEIRTTDEGQDGASEAGKALETAGYELSELELPGLKRVPEGIDMLVILNPAFNLSIAGVRLIQDYLKKGGSLLVLMDAMRPADSLNQLLSVFGVRLNDDFLALGPDDPRVRMLGQNTALVNRFSPEHPLTSGFTQREAWSLYLNDARSVRAIASATGQRGEELLSTVSENISISEVYEVQDLKDLKPERIGSGSFPVLAEGHWLPGGAAEPKKARALAMGSCSFIMNHSFNKGGHRDFFLGMVRYLAEEKVLIAPGSSPESPEDRLQITRAASVWVLFGICFLYPFLWLLGGLAVWQRRKKHEL